MGGDGTLHWISWEWMFLSCCTLHESASDSSIEGSFPEIHKNSLLRLLLACCVCWDALFWYATNVLMESLHDSCIVHTQFRWIFTFFNLVLYFILQDINLFWHDYYSFYYRVSTSNASLLILLFLFWFLAGRHISVLQTYICF